MHRLELKIPPAAVVLVFAGLMWVVAELAPWAEVAIPGKEWIALALWLVGVMLIASGIATFIAARTTANPFTPDQSSSLVTHGVYRFSRNPMYAGFLLLLAAWNVYLENSLPLLLLPLFVWYLNRFQIIPEEKVLLTKFGEDYADYLKTVRRWL